MDQAYVEYDGKVTDTDELVEVLNAEMKRLVESGGKTCTKIMAVSYRQPTRPPNREEKTSVVVQPPLTRTSCTDSNSVA